MGFATSSIFNATFGDVALMAVDRFYEDRFFPKQIFLKDLKNNVKTELTTQNNSLLPVDAKIRK
jgi:hypothetical protein